MPTGVGNKLHAKLICLYSRLFDDGRKPLTEILDYLSVRVAEDKSIICRFLTD